MSKKSEQKTSKPSYRLKRAVVQCLRVLDGETFVATWEEQRWFRKHKRNVPIRLAKISCPGKKGGKGRGGQSLSLQDLLLQEPQLSAKGAAEATVYLRQMIEGKNAMLEYAQYPNGEIIKDERGSILAMVFTIDFLGMKGKNLNVEQVRLGNAEVETSDSSKDEYYWSTAKYDREFDAAYKDAERHQRGIHKGKKPKGLAQKPETPGLYIYCLLSFLLGFFLGFLIFVLLFGPPQ